MKTNIQTIVSPPRPPGSRSYSHLPSSILVTAFCSQRPLSKHVSVYNLTTEGNFSSEVWLSINAHDALKLEWSKFRINRTCSNATAAKEFARKRWDRLKKDCNLAPVENSKISCMETALEGTITMLWGGHSHYPMVCSHLLLFPSEVAWLDLIWSTQDSDFQVKAHPAPGKVDDMKLQTLLPWIWTPGTGFGSSTSSISPFPWASVIGCWDPSSNVERLLC